MVIKYLKNDDKLFHTYKKIKKTIYLWILLHKKNVTLKVKGWGSTNAIFWEKRFIGTQQKTKQNLVLQELQNYPQTMVLSYFVE